MPEENNHSFGGVVLGLCITGILLIVACPFALVWALNGLFELSIPYDIFHWVCAAVLILMIKGDVK